MRRKRKSFTIGRVYLPMVLVLVLCFATQGVAQEPAEKKADQKPSISSFGVEEPRDAETFFREAQKLSPNDPMGAIRLYRLGIILKPDAWAERKQLGTLYETQQQWNPALAEYETINKATGSSESFADVVRTLDKAGYPRSAALMARKAFAKYPGQPEFLYLAGELFQKSGAGTEAAQALQEYAKLKPQEGKTFLLLGSIHEKAGRPADALRAYLHAEQLMKNDRDTADAVKRLRSHASTIEGLTIFLPPGWSPEKDGLLHVQEGERVSVTVKTSGDPAAQALSSAGEAMPQGLFSAENLKLSEGFMKMKKELAKTDPESAKKMPAIPMPFSSTGDVPGITGAKMALLSTSETAQPGMESAAAIAVPSGGRIYIFLWRAPLPVLDGKKTLTHVLSQTVWPL